MSRNSKAAWAVLIGLPLVMVAVWLLGDLGWLGVVLEIVAIAGGVAAFRWMLAYQPLADGENFSSEEFSNVALPTASEEYTFSFSASARWICADRQLEEDAQAAIAREALLNRARKLTASWRPEQVDLAAHDLAAALSAKEEAPGHKLTAWAADVLLVMPPADRLHLESVVKVKREIDLWELRIEKEQKARAYLKDDALKSADDAVVWWLSRNESNVEQAVELSGVLARLSDLATGKASEGTGAIARSLVDAIGKVNQEDQRALADELAQSLAEAGLTDEAAEIRRTFEIEDLGAKVIGIAHGSRIPAADESRDS